MADAAAAEAPAPKKGKMGLIIIVLIVVIALGGGGAAAMLLLKSGGETQGKTAAAKKEGGGGEHGAAAEGGERGVLSLESFIANLADAEGERYIKCTMRLELQDKHQAEALKADELAITKIRDKILTLLTSKTYSQVASSEGKDKLREEIRSQLDPLLLGGHVSGVYYTEFIVQ